MTSNPSMLKQVSQALGGRALWIAQEREHVERVNLLTETFLVILAALGFHYGISDKHTKLRPMWFGFYVFAYLCIKWCYQKGQDQYDENAARVWPGFLSLQTELPKVMSYYGGIGGNYSLELTKLLDREEPLLIDGSSAPEVVDLERDSHNLVCCV